MTAPANIAELRAWAAVEKAAELDDILSRWHHWRSGYMLVRNRSGGNATSEYRSSRQYDDENGALDDAIECRTMESVEFQVCELTTVHQAAIMSNARALYCGAAVWTHPRLPSDPVERQVVTAGARAALQRRLIAAGVM